MKSTLTSVLLHRTHQVIKRLGIKQDDHYTYVWRSYIYAEEDSRDTSSSTISRNMRGLSLPPWSLVRHYAQGGTRCPDLLQDDLRIYISGHYRTQSLRDQLRNALIGMLQDIPAEDAEDIAAYWDVTDLAHMWAVMAWYCLCQDYAVRYGCIM